MLLRSGSRQHVGGRIVILSGTAVREGIVDGASRHQLRRRARGRKVLLDVDVPGRLRLEDVELVVLVELRAGDEVRPLEQDVVVDLDAGDVELDVGVATRALDGGLGVEGLNDLALELGDGGHVWESELEVDLVAVEIGAAEKSVHL